MFAIYLNNIFLLFNIFFLLRLQTFYAFKCPHLSPLTVKRMLNIPDIPDFTGRYFFLSLKNLDLEAHLYRLLWFKH